MNVMRLMGLPVLLGMIVVSSAQDAETADTPPFAWRVSGDTVETFKLQFEANRAIDQSSAKAVVESYAAYTDNRPSTAGAMDEVGSKWDEALARTLETYEAKLLDAEFMKRRAAPQDEQDSEVTFTSTRGEEKVDGESVEDGINWVQTVQTIKIRQKDWQSGEWKATVEDSITRYACEKCEDGKWRIARIEQQRKQISKGGEVSNVWREQAPMLDFMLFYRQQYEDRKALPALKQDTPQTAALSLFEHLVPKREELGNSIHSKGLKAWTDLLEGLFTPARMEAARKKFTDWGKNAVKPEKRVIESTTDGAGGIKIVRIKPRDEWSAVIELRLKQVDKLWKITEAGYLQDKMDREGKVVKEFVAELDIYALDRR